MRRNFGIPWITSLAICNWQWHVLLRKLFQSTRQRGAGWSNSEEFFTPCWTDTHPWIRPGKKSWGLKITHVPRSKYGIPHFRCDNLHLTTFELKNLKHMNDDWWLRSAGIQALPVLVPGKPCCKGMCLRPNETLLTLIIKIITFYDDSLDVTVHFIHIYLRLNGYLINWFTENETVE